MADIYGNYYVCADCANYYVNNEGEPPAPADLGGIVIVDTDNPILGQWKMCDGCNGTVLETYQAIVEDWK